MASRQRNVRPKAAAAPEPVVGATTESLPVETLPTEPVVVELEEEVVPGVKLFISPARVRKHIDTLFINAAIDKLIVPLRAVLAECKHHKTVVDTGKLTVDGVERAATAEESAASRAWLDSNAAAVEDAKARINALSSERTRFSNKTSTVLSIICEEVVTQLVSFASNNVNNSKNKTVSVKHLYRPGFEALPLYPLICSLPSVKEGLADANAATAKLELAKLKQTLLSQAEKDFRKKYGIKAPKKTDEPAPAAATAETEPAAVEPAEEPKKNKFIYFIGKLCTHVVNSTFPNQKFRVSNEIRTHLTRVVEELLHTLAPLVLLTAHSMKNKTVNDSAIMKTVELLLGVGRPYCETVDVVPGEQYKVTRHIFHEGSAFYALNDVVNKKLNPVVENTTA